jgi:hypothetical protein
MATPNALSHSLTIFFISLPLLPFLSFSFYFSFSFPCRQGFTNQTKLSIQQPNDQEIAKAAEATNEFDNIHSCTSQQPQQLKRETVNIFSIPITVALEICSVHNNAIFQHSFTKVSLKTDPKCPFTL